MANPWFSPTYCAARARFRDAIGKTDAQLTSLDLGLKAPCGGDLTIDIAWFGSESPKRLFIHSSGLHGVEGFAGSAIQLQWLHAGIPPVPADSAIAIVHILNPHGMAWKRRFNENNVDLNRNFRTPGDFDPTPPPFWHLTNKLLNPPSPPRQDWFYLRAAALVIRYGMPTLRQAIAGGQSTGSEGLFFAGGKVETGPAGFEEFLRPRLNRMERIVGVDVHTGLGRSGTDRLLVDERLAGTRTIAEMQAAYGDHIELLNSAGIAYTAKGAQQDMYFRALPNAEIMFASQEFGTYPGLAVLNALRNENRWHFHGGRRGTKAELDHPSKQAVVDIFGPPDNKWREAILKRGAEVIAQGLRLAFA